MKTGSKHKVAALDKVLGVCNAYGSGYMPSKSSLTPTAMKTLLELAQEKLKAVTVTRTAYAMAVNARAEAFAGIPALAAQITRLASASGASSEDIREVRMIKSKFYTARKKKSQVMNGSQPEGGPAPQGTRSSSRLDMLGKMETFENLIQVVQSIPGYNPNEPEFKVEALRAKLAELRDACNAVAMASIAYSNAQVARDMVIYGAEGVVETKRAAMDYLRGKFGVRSAESYKANIQASDF